MLRLSGPGVLRVSVCLGETEDQMNDLGWCLPGLPNVTSMVVFFM